MVLRTQAVRRRLTRLEEIQTTLAGLDYQPSVPESAWAVERGLHLGAECIFDIGNHILSAGFGTSVDGYEQILDALAELRVIDEELRTALAGFGGFRNILVHGYLDLDPERVQAAHEKASKLFSRYRLQIEQWLSTRDR